MCRPGVREGHAGVQRSTARCRAAALPVRKRLLQASRAIPFFWKSNPMMTQSSGFHLQLLVLAGVHLLV